ncbi:outer membrane autotransporter barrel domain-containing protein [Cetobacterium ceti]|uniref:Outer membrane autotransporter barrel domain-containing protein n=1 Tax=Cetobacterium ceti TaxID=180163 RepID=A0A1T4LYQ4_9FUSO|nr:autotransporter outer membrane beta-barrel domain-containing protein [Cetobacterium ceti]SJZ59604.1 outer membrane autotransporter barrel domain-containing protein [Cetobacterium ceti]
MKKALLIMGIILAINAYGASENEGVLFFGEGVYKNMNMKNIDSIHLKHRKSVKSDIKKIKFVPPIIWVEGVGVKGRDYTNRGILSSALDYEGVYVTSDGVGENKDIIKCEGIDTVGMRGTNSATVINNGTIITNEKWQRGMNSLGDSTIINSGKIEVNGPISFGLDGFDNSKVINNTTIDVNGQYGIGITGGDNSLLVNNGVIRLNQKENMGIEVWNRNRGNVNNGTIYVKSGDGVMLLNGGKLTNSKSGLIKTEDVYGVGVYLGSDGSDFENHGTIDVEKGIGITGGYKSTSINERDGKIEVGLSGKGLFLTARGEGINNGTIDVNGGVGVYSYNNGNFINNGLMNIDNTGTGIYLNGYTRASNNGVINLNSGLGFRLSDKSIFTNEKNGVINVKFAQLLKLDTGDSKFINKGTINNESILTLPKEGKFYLEKSGKIRAKELDGNIYLGKTFTNTYGNEPIKSGKLIVGEWHGKPLMETPLYRATKEKKSDGYVIKVTRNKFTKVIKNEKIGRYLENNFRVLPGKKGKTRDFVFETLSGIPGEKVLNEDVENFLGNKFYGTLDKGTRDIVNFNRETLFNNVFSVNTNKDVRFIGGFNYSHRRVKENRTLYGFNEDLGGIYLGGDKKLSENLRGGGILTFGQSNFKYSNNSHRKDNIYEGNIYGIYNVGKSGKFIVDGFLGSTDGRIRREMKLGVLNRDYKSKIKNRYYGVSGKLESKLAFGQSYFIPSIGVDYSVIKGGKVKESGEYGLNIKKRSLNFLDGKLGGKLGHTFNLSKDWKFNGEVGYTYIHDFKRGYRNLVSTMRDFSLDTYELSKYNSRKNRNTYGVKLSLIKDSTSFYFKYLRGENSENQYILGLSYKF